jgi:hypothetical protein
MRTSELVNKICQTEPKRLIRDIETKCRLQTYDCVGGDLRWLSNMYTTKGLRSTAVTLVPLRSLILQVTDFNVYE